MANGQVGPLLYHGKWTSSSMGCYLLRYICSFWHPTGHQRGWCGGWWSRKEKRLKYSALLVSHHFILVGIEQVTGDPCSFLFFFFFDSKDCCNSPVGKWHGNTRHHLHLTVSLFSFLCLLFYLYITFFLWYIVLLFELHCPHKILYIPRKFLYLQYCLDSTTAYYSLLLYLSV